ncbi:MAG TPA: histidine kinase dimerization/phospho-acceptor domain-containing protein, partial [Abditibacterium sp.]
MSSPASEIDVNALMRGLVHELRNPLSAIITASSLLLPAENMDEEAVMLLDVVQKEARRMNRI